MEAAAAIPVQADVPIQAAVPVQAAVPIQADVPVQAAVQSPVPAVQAPVGWDPYEKQEYIRPVNPYDTSLIDPWSEEDSSDVGSEDKNRDTKVCQVLRRLQSGQYDVYFANEFYNCPFYNRRLGVTDFNCLVMHAEGISSCTPKICEIVNLDAFYAKHKALGIYLRNLQQVAIAEGRMHPIRHRRR